MLTLVPVGPFPIETDPKPLRLLPMIMELPAVDPSIFVKVVVPLRLIVVPLSVNDAAVCPIFTLPPEALFIFTDGLLIVVVPTTLFPMFKFAAPF
jgi:hypothetical protein